MRTLCRMASLRTSNVRVVSLQGLTESAGSSGNDEKLWEMADDDPNIAPDLVPLRETLMTMTGRPVNIQATRKAAMRFRGETLGQPYLTLIENTEES